MSKCMDELDLLFLLLVELDMDPNEGMFPLLRMLVLALVTNALAR
jgi:hypothetical protein